MNGKPTWLPRARWDRRPSFILSQFGNSPDSPEFRDSRTSRWQSSASVDHPEQGLMRAANCVRMPLCQ